MERGIEGDGAFQLFGLPAVSYDEEATLSGRRRRGQIRGNTIRGNTSTLSTMMIDFDWYAGAWRRRAAAVGIAMLSAVPHLPARAQASGGIVTGTVAVLGTERPISGATATIDDSQRGAVSDSLGRYRIVGVSPGEHLLVIRRIGFESVSARVTVPADGDLTADVDLRPSAPAQLEEVRVVADSQRWGKLAGMEHRRSIQAGGTFITSAELDSAVASGRSLPMVLARKLPGAQIRQYGRTGGALLSSGRGRTSGRDLPLADPIDPKSPRACWAQVYLDGMRLYSPKYGGSMAVPDLRDIPVESLSGVEFYAGEAQTPAEFAGEGAACGTIVFWTK